MISISLLLKSINNSVKKKDCNTFKKKKALII